MANCNIDLSLFNGNELIVSFDLSGKVINKKKY